MEIHPPHGPIHSLKEFSLQLVTITAGILIALSLEGLVEWNHNRALVREARTTISREIADNRKELEEMPTQWDSRKRVSTPHSGSPTSCSKKRSWMFPRSV